VSELSRDTPPEPAAPAPPKFREVSIPAGSTLAVRLTTAVASNTNKVEDRITGTLARPVVAGGGTAVAKGSAVTGSVVEANESGRVKGRASIAFRFDRLVVGDESHQIHTATIRREAAVDRRGDLEKGGIGAGVGAIIGGIAGGGKGAAIGAGVGGAGTVLATKGKEVTVLAGTIVTTTLQEPLTVLVPVSKPESRLDR
jgi:hypothetical protein